MTHDNHSVSDQADEVSLLHVHEMFLLGSQFGSEDRTSSGLPRAFSRTKMLSSG